MSRSRGGPPLWACLLVVAAAAGGAESAGAATPAKVAISGVRLGFDGLFKAGCWLPIAVDVESAGGEVVADLEIVANDSDGVPTSLLKPRIVLPSGGAATIHHYVRIAADDSTIELTLRESGRVLARRRLGPSELENHRPQPRRASIVVAVGEPAGLSGEEDREDDQRPYRPRVARIRRLSELPRQWYAYDAVDAIVATASDPRRWSELDVEQVEAIRTWVRQGGRLVVSVGANWEWAAGAFFGEMLPARIEGLQTVHRLAPEVRSIEALAGGEASLELGGQGLPMLRLKEVRGRSLPHLQAGGAASPAAVRGAYGLGTVALIAFDVEEGPFRDWDGRREFWRSILDLDRDPVEARAQGRNARLEGGRDLGVWIDRRLEEFADAAPIPFSLVALLLLGYIAWIGPVEYFLLKRGFQRLELTWITLPLTVALIGVATYSATSRWKGDELRANRIEIVDVDARSGTLRGASFASLLSPTIDRYTVAARPVLAADGAREGLGAEGSQHDRVTSWLGELADDDRPSAALASLLGSGSYNYASPAPSAVLGVPMRAWSVKKFSLRWLAEARPVVEADLRHGKALALEPELAGALINRLSSPIEDAVLLWGDYGYRLGALQGTAKGGEPAPLSLTLEMQRPLSTLLNEMRIAAPQRSPSGSEEGGGFGADAVPFAVNLAVAARQSAGATESENAALDDWRLRPLLDLGKAVLIGRVEAQGCEFWATGGTEAGAMDSRVDPSVLSGAPPSLRGPERRLTLLRVVLELKTHD
jgi:hypothetical protein